VLCRREIRYNGSVKLDGLEERSMIEVLTLEQIRQQYDGEWVMIAYTETDPETYEVIRGKVLAHSKDAQDVYDAIDRAEGQGVAFEFFGQVPENVAFIL
jgi:hypothetical protein